MKPEIETPASVKRTIGTKPKEKAKSLPKNQRGPQVKHMCHHCGVQGHTRPNYFKLHALKKADSMCGQEISKRRPKGAQSKGDSEGHLIGDVMEMLKSISLCLLVSLRGLKVMLVIPHHLRLSPKILVKNG